MKNEEAINELVRHKQEVQNDFGWNITLQEALDAAISALKAQPCENAIVIPAGATIGDVIKTLFPSLEQTGTHKDVDFYLLDGETPYSAKLNTFRSWWNAPYERGEQK